MRFHFRMTLSDLLKGADLRYRRLGAGLLSGQARGGRHGAAAHHPSAAPPAGGGVLRRSRRAPPAAPVCDRSCSFHPRLPGHATTAADAGLIPSDSRRDVPCSHAGLLGFTAGGSCGGDRRWGRLGGTDGLSLGTHQQPGHKGLRRTPAALCTRPA